MKKTFPGRFESLTLVSDFVATAAREAGLNDFDVYNVQMAVDEACANIIQHGYGGDDSGEIECSCVIGEDRLTVELRDYGAEFNPCEMPEPNLTGALEDRGVGGLGIYLMCKLVDGVEFERDGPANVLTLVKCTESAN
ncbi:MAG: ATP-binding protein [Anaerolineae bacterium]|nr:ATP-binding protein [Anaerolineae bacterium]